MTESQKLSALRDKLIRRRRASSRAFRLLLPVSTTVMTLCGFKMKSKRWSGQWQKRSVPNFASDDAPVW